MNVILVRVILPNVIVFNVILLSVILLKLILLIVVLLNVIMLTVILLSVIFFSKCLHSVECCIILLNVVILPNVVILLNFFIIQNAVIQLITVLRKVILLNAICYWVSFSLKSWHFQIFILTLIFTFETRKVLEKKNSVNIILIFLLSNQILFYLTKKIGKFSQNLIENDATISIDS